jgi:membrane-associated phospholipid phosphatase
MSGIVTNFSGKIQDFGYAIGFFSEFILLFFVTMMLIAKSEDPGTDVVVYVMGLIMSGGINTVLKRWIQQPRPHDPLKFLYSEQFDRRRTVYGMPSGHSQNVFYSIAYLFVSLRDTPGNLSCGKESTLRSDSSLGSIRSEQSWIWASCAAIAVLTWIERWKFHNHTLSQLMIGALVGVGLAYVVIRLRDVVTFPYDSLRETCQSLRYTPTFPWKRRKHSRKDV